ncbi:hypothetical protein F4810DRAFT_716326 [Camillea tinctor]|nr:hypothetical protein F4810DRAFT_716326 [Camillea tinctor]
MALSHSPRSSEDIDDVAYLEAGSPNGTGDQYGVKRERSKPSRSLDDSASSSTNLAPDLGSKGDINASQGELLSKFSENDSFPGFSDDELDLVTWYLHDQNIDLSRWQLDNSSPLSQPSPARWDSTSQAEPLQRQSDSSRALWFDPETLAPWYTPSHGGRRYLDKTLWAVTSYKLTVLLQMGEGMNWQDIRFARIDAEKRWAAEKREREEKRKREEAEAQKQK